MAGSVERDRAWFERLCHRYQGELLTHARRLLRSRNEFDAEDVVQRTLMTAWEKRCRVPDEDPMGWLYRTLFHHVQRWWDENRQAPVPLPDDLAERLVARGGDFEVVERSRDLLPVWAALTDSEREVLTLCGEGVSHSQIAQALGVSEPAVRKRLQRAREHVRDLLDGDHGDRGGARGRKSTGSGWQGRGR